MKKMILVGVLLLAAGGLWACEMGKAGKEGYEKTGTCPAGTSCSGGEKTKKETAKL